MKKFDAQHDLKNHVRYLTGIRTMINLKPTISMTTNDAITQFDPEERGCYAPGEANLTYLTAKRGYRYELNNCILDREIREIIWECRCMPHFATSNSEYLEFIPFCSGKKLYCANMILKSISMDEDYGNTGCRVFEQGVQNWKDFCLKINIPKENY